MGLLASEEIPRDKTVFYGIIADGIHTHAAALRIAFRTHPKGTAGGVIVGNRNIWH